MTDLILLIFIVSCQFFSHKDFEYDIIQDVHFNSLLLSDLLK